MIDLTVLQLTSPTLSVRSPATVTMPGSSSAFESMDVTEVKREEVTTSPTDGAAASRPKLSLSPVAAQPPTKVDADKFSTGEMELQANKPSSTLPATDNTADADVKPEGGSENALGEKQESLVMTSSEAVKPEGEPQGPVKTDPVKNESVSSSAPPATINTSANSLATAQPVKPKEKKRFSLADYKKKRQQEAKSLPSKDSLEVKSMEPTTADEMSSATLQSDSMKPSLTSGVTMLPSTLSEIKLPQSLVRERMAAATAADPTSDGGGTPTLDEKVATIGALPPPPAALNAFSVLAKFDKLEQAQKEIKVSGHLILHSILCNNFWFEVTVGMFFFILLFT